MWNSGTDHMSNGSLQAVTGSHNSRSVATLISTTNNEGPFPPDSDDYTKVHLLQGCWAAVCQTFSNQLYRMGTTLTAHWISDNMTVITLINIKPYKPQLLCNYYWLRILCCESVKLPPFSSLYIALYFPTAGEPIEAPRIIIKCAAREAFIVKISI